MEISAVHVTRMDIPSDVSKQSSISERPGAKGRHKFREVKACRKSGLDEKNAGSGFREGPHFGFQVSVASASTARFFFMSLLKPTGNQRRSELREPKSVFTSM